MGGLAPWVIQRLDLAVKVPPTRWQFLSSVVPRDPRLPPPGVVLRKTYENQVHEVLVLKRGFKYRDREYSSISAVAKAVCRGMSWNGFVFFAEELGIKQPSKGGVESGIKVAPYVVATPFHPLDSTSGRPDPGRDAPGKRTLSPARSIRVLPYLRCLASQPSTSLSLVCLDGSLTTIS